MKIWTAMLAAILLVADASAQKPKTTVYLAGDSTCAIKLPERRPETGWGEKFGEYFKAGKVTIENRAMNGRSTRTFISEGRWQSIVEALRKGDFVFIQFGHNDAAKDRVDRYTPPEDFRRNLAKFVAEVRAKGATPVLLTPVVRRRFDASGKFYDSHGDYPGILRSVSKELGVALIDVHRESEALLIKYGVEESKRLFLILAKGESPNYPNGLDDNTHFSPRGAEEVAGIVAAGVKDARLKLRKYLK